MDAEAWRREFPTLGHTTYLNTCSLGLLGRRSRRGVEAFLDEWERRGASAWYDTWLQEVQALRESTANLLGCGTHEVAVLPSVSVALDVLADALQHRDRAEVVTHALDFPTVPYQWMTRRDAALRTVKSPDGVTSDPRDFEAHVTDETLAVATSHVFYTTGFTQDIEAIADIARDRGAVSIVDAYQATGQLPTDVKDLGVDVLLTGGLKWLLGGPGVVTMYVREGLHETLEPHGAGWFAHAEQFEFQPHRFQPREDARRFETGTPSMASVAAARAGVDLVQEVGVEAIRTRTLELVDDLVDRLEDAGMPPRLAPNREDRTGIVTIPLQDPASAVEALARDDVIVDHRPGRLRVSPYFYNTPGDNERLVDALRDHGAAPGV